MSTDLDKLWNSIVDENCPGIGARHLYVLIMFTGECSNGGILHAVESVQEDEADGDPDYTISQIIDACAWAQSDRTWAEATSVTEAIAATQKVLAHSQTLSESAADDYLEVQEGELEALLPADFEDWLEDLLAHKHATNPADFT